MFTDQDHTERWSACLDAKCFYTWAQFVLNLLADFSPVKNCPAHAPVRITKVAERFATGTS